MNEKPIIFSGDMVKAILDGRKTQTRRVIKPQPDEDGLSCDAGYPFIWYDTDNKPQKCPYGTGGTKLWVRETLANIGGWAYYAAPSATLLAHEHDEVISVFTKTHVKWRWKFNKLSQRYMPYEAARTFCRITNIRVERVREISKEDAVAEGIPWRWTNDTEGEGEETLSDVVIDDFGTLWDSINGKRQGCSWEDNPWCWCLTFQRII